jgi:HEAT repeat protein
VILVSLGLAAILFFSIGTPLSVASETSPHASFPHSETGAVDGGDLAQTVSVYSLQVGAFSKRDIAVLTMAQLKNIGVACEMQKIRSLHRVFCGSAETRSGLAELKKKLSGLGYRDAYVIKRKKRVRPKEEPSVGKASPERPATAEKPGKETIASGTERGNTPSDGPGKREIIRAAGAGHEALDEGKSSMATRDTANEPEEPASPATGSSIPQTIMESHPISGKRFIELIMVLLVSVVVMGLVSVLVVRRMRAFQAFRSRRIFNRYQDLFRGLTRESSSVSYLARKLSRIGDIHVIEQIIDRAASQSSQRETFLTLYDATGVTDRYISILSSSRSWKKRAFACEKLGLIGSAKAVPLLLSIVRDVNNEDEDVRSVALRSLGRIKDARAIPVLVEALGYPETWLPPRIAEILVSIGDECVEYLIRQLKDFQSESRRAWSAEVLGWLNASSAVMPLIGSLLDASPEVRARAAGALGRLKDERAVASLTELLVSEPVPFVRTKVSEALGQMGNPSVIQHLINLLKDPEWWVRVRAVEALEHIGEQSIPSLLVALEDEDFEVRRRAAIALERIGYVRRILEEYGNEQYRPELRKILFLIAQAGAVESLCDKLENSGGTVQKRIVRLLGDAGTKESAEPLIDLLGKATDWTLKARIIQSLGKIGSRDAVPLLIDNLKDGEYWVRRSAVEALARLEAGDFADDIANILNDPNPQARESALRALSALKVDRHWEKIENLLLDPASRVRSTALMVMRELGITTEREKIISALTESAEEVRIEAIKYFAALVDSDVMMDIVRLLPVGSQKLRDEIVEYVRRIKPASFGPIRELFDPDSLPAPVLSSLMEIASVVRDEDARNFIMNYTGSTDAMLRESAFRAMAEFGFQKHAKLFQKALFDPSSAVRTIVLACVSPDTEDSFLEKAKMLSNDPDENVRVALLLAIGATKMEKMKPVVMQMFDDPSRKVVGAALICLAAFHDPLFLERFYQRKDIKEIREEIAQIAEEKRFNSIIDEIRAFARTSRNLEVEMLFARNEREFAEELTKRLRESLDPVIRMKAIELLKLSASPDLFTSILSVMKKDPYPDVRIAAMDVVTAIGREDEVISALSATLADPSPSVRVRAAEMLGRYNNPAALEALLNVLDTTDREFREAITTALSEMLSGDATRAAELVKSVPETKTRKIGMAWLMGKSRSRGAVNFLLNLLEDNDPDVRASAIGALGKFRRRQLVNTLGRFIFDPNERVRAAAVNAVAMAGGDRAFETIQEALQDIDSFVRIRAVVGLARISMKKCIEVLKARVARFPEFQSCLIAVRFCENASSIDAEALDETAVRIISELCDRNELMETYRNSSDTRKRVHAFRVLSVINADGNSELVRMALSDPLPEIRKEAKEQTISLG